MHNLHKLSLYLSYKIENQSMRKYLVVLFLFAGLNLSAQDYLDLARLSYTIAPNTLFDNTVKGTTITDFYLQFDLPTVLNEKTALITGFVANITKIDLAPNQMKKTGLNTFNFRLGLNIKHSETWTGTYLILPRISTDFSHGFHRGVQFGAVGLLSKKKSSKLKYTFGLYTNREEYGQSVVPLLGGYYLSPDEIWEVTALLPAAFDVNYKLSSKVSTGVNFDGMGNTYTIDTEEFQDAYVTRGSSQLYGYAQFELVPSLFLRTKVGYELRGTKVFDQDDKVSLSFASIYIGDHRTVLNIEQRNNFLFKAELFFRFNLPKEKDLQKTIDIN